MKSKARSTRTKSTSSSIRRIVAVAAFTAIVVGLAGVVLWFRHGTRPVVVANAGNGADIALITLDPASFEGEARESYRIARQHPELLAALHCYCHCDVRLGHRNLLDCYRDEHAASCGICMGEARDAAQMAKQGTAPEEIRATLKARYENQE